MADQDRLTAFRALLDDKQTGSGPITYSDGGKPGHDDDLAHVHMERFAGMPTEKRAAFATQIDDMLETRFGTDADNSKLGKFREQLPEMLEHATTAPTLEANGGGLAIRDKNIMFTDARTHTPEDMFKGSFGIPADNTTLPLSYPPELQEVHAEFIKLHEGAHAALGLEEPGSDYIASAGMLTKHPDSDTVKGYLNHMADLRYIAGFRGSEQAREKYGAENYDAIHDALNQHANGTLPPEHDLDEWIAKAKIHDAANTKNNLAGVGSIGAKTCF